MSSSPKIVRQLYYAVAATLLAGSLAATLLLARADEWHPLVLVLLLGALVLVGEFFTATIRAQTVSPIAVVLVLAMSLLGAAPAVAFGLGAMIYTSATRRIPLAGWMANLATFAAFPLAGAVVVRVLIGDVHDPKNLQATRGFAFGAVVFGVFLGSVLFSFVLNALARKVFWGRGVREQAEQLLVPLWPAHLAAAVLTAVAALAYTNLGLGWSVGSVLVLVIFQQLVVRMIRAENLAEQFRTKVFELVSSQVGQIKAAVNFLDGRDGGSERHAATVAIYARELAKEAGCSEEEQYLVHAAGLAHDIGRLRFSDRVLHEETIVDENDWQEIRRHPIEGSDWIGHIHGYGPVADIVLSHHERWDGSGYPDHLIGPEIPLLSRILAICEAFDAMTGPDTYRPRIAPAEAFEELRNGAGAQFDPELVDTFVAMREQKGAEGLAIEDANFDAELDFERKIRMFNDPEDSTAQTSQKLMARLSKLFVQT